MKTVKRILAVFLLMVTVALAGYLAFTGNRLPMAEEEAAYETSQEI